MATPSYIAQQLRVNLNVEVPVDVVTRVLDENAFLFVHSPALNVGLWDGQPNKWRVLSTIDEVRRETIGWNYDNARVLSATVLRGADPLLTVTLGAISPSERLIIETLDEPPRKFVVDTGAPTSHLFKLMEPKKAYDNATLTTRWEPIVGKGVDVHQLTNMTLSMTLCIGLPPIRITSASFNFMDQVALEKLKTNLLAGADGILGMDVLKQCDFFWSTQGVVLLPCPHAKRFY